jgi:hypothetical protein
LDETHRRDYEIYYMKDAYRQFLDAIGDKATMPTSLEDDRLQSFMVANHSRFFQLCEKYGSPVGVVQIQKDLNLISTSAAKVDIVSEVPETHGKVLSKKLLLTMTVAQLKAMCSKLFKVEVINQQLIYIETGFDNEYAFDEDHRQLSFFSVKDGGKIIVR